MSRRFAVACLLTLVFIGAVAAALSTYSAYYKYNFRGAAVADSTSPLQMFVDTGGDTRAFRGGQFGAVNVDVSEHDDGLLFVKVTQQVVVKAKDFDPSTDRLFLHVDGLLTGVIEAHPDRAEVLRQNVLYLDGEGADGTIKLKMPFEGTADISSSGRQSLNIPMEGRLFAPDETTKLDPSLAPEVVERLNFSFTKSSDSIFYAGAAFIVEPPVVKRLDSWERLLQISWNPDLGEPFPLQAQKGLEVGVSLCDCAAARIRSDADKAFSTFNQQVIRWKYAEVGNLELTQESESLKFVTKSSLWVLGAVVLALILSLLPNAMQSMFGIALGRAATPDNAGKAAPSPAFNGQGKHGTTKKSGRPSTKKTGRTAIEKPSTEQSGMKPARGIDHGSTKSSRRR